MTVVARTFSQSAVSKMISISLYVNYASALMYLDCMHAVMLKPASVHFTFISGYGYLI